MKNSIRQKFSNLQKSILYVMSFSFLVLIAFILVIYQNKNSNNDNTATAIVEGIIAFLFIFILLYKLNKDLKLTNSAKEDLEANEIKYRNLIENAGIVMYTASVDGVLTFVNSKGVELTGYSLREIVGMHFTEFIDADWVEVVTEKYKMQLINNIQETLTEFCIRTKFGDLKWVEQSAILLMENGMPVGFQCIVKDISERKEMEDVLRKYEVELVQNQERLQSILDNATSLIYIKDLDGRYLLTNKQFKEVLGVSDDMVIGKTDFDITDFEQASRFKATDECVIKTRKPVETEEMIEVSDGSHNMLIVKFPLLNGQNEMYGISGIATDITERVRYQEELIKARRIAEDAKRLQEQFLANMSHEIRTPMNGIQGMTDLLLETHLTDEQKDFAKTIKRSSDNLLVIINDILDFSKIKAGKLTIEKIDFDLGEVLENIKAIFKHRIHEKHLSFNINVDQAVPLTLNGDPFRLNQILVNLIGNAIKFTHNGGITVDVFLQNATPKVAEVSFSITDTGIGIEQGKIDEIFESFTQASVETSRKYGGSGLGLSITKQLLELQDGKISVESNVKTGTTFKFSIPYDHSTTNSPALFRGKDSNNYRCILKGFRFLVAEDNEVNQKVIKHVLQKAGGVVDIANNGVEAVSFLKQSANYDVIIMDLQMPEMDGYAATKYIRNVMNLSIPIMAMTASALKGEKLKCIEMGMNDYLSKPFDFTFLYERLLLLLSNAETGVDPKSNDQTNENHLFDLSMLEEMDDNEYLSEILSIFLDHTPVELLKLNDAFMEKNPDEVYKVAHKLKSSAGLFQANDLLTILIKIEAASKEKNEQVLEDLITQAKVQYHKLENPLKEKLKTIKAATAA